VTAYSALAIEDVDTFLFGTSPHPVVLKNGLSIGGGQVYPDVNFILPSMTINAETMPEVRDQYLQMVKAFEPNRWMLWGDKASDDTSYWGLDPIDETHTRLITRLHMRYRWTSPLPDMPFRMGDCRPRKRGRWSLLARPRVPYNLE
jgi:Methanol-cobalamin methyltransferase B subunit